MSCAPASARSVAGGPGLPDVLADRRADEHVAEAQQDEVARRREVAVLVEDAVVRQEALAVDAADLAVGEDGARVVEVGVEVRRADERGDAVRRVGDRLDARSRRAEKPAGAAGPRAGSR